MYKVIKSKDETPMRVIIDYNYFRWPLLGPDKGDVIKFQCNNHFVIHAGFVIAAPLPPFFGGGAWIKVVPA